MAQNAIVLCAYAPPHRICAGRMLFAILHPTHPAAAAAITFYTWCLPRQYTTHSTVSHIAYYIVVRMDAKRSK